MPLASNLWAKIPSLSHLIRKHYCRTRSEARAADALVKALLSEHEKPNQQPNQYELLNMFRVVVLVLQIRGAANNMTLIDGTTAEDGDMTPEEWKRAKHQERQLIPKLDAALHQALAQSGGTGAQRKLSEDITTTAEAASQVYDRYRIHAEGE